MPTAVPTAAAFRPSSPLGAFAPAVSPLVPATLGRSARRRPLRIGRSALDRRGRDLVLGTPDAPLHRHDVLTLFDFLRRAAHADRGRVIRLTAQPGVLGSLVDDLANADGCHGLVIDLLWESARHDVLWQDLEALAGQGLFVRLVFAEASASRDWQPWLERAAACGASDVRWLGPRSERQRARLDRWRLTHGMPRVPVGRG